MIAKESTINAAIGRTENHIDLLVRKRRKLARTEAKDKEEETRINAEFELVSWLVREERRTLKNLQETLDFKYGVAQ